MKIQFKVVSPPPPPPPPTPEPAFGCYRYVDAAAHTRMFNKLRAAWCGTAAPLRGGGLTPPARPKNRWKLRREQKNGLLPVTLKKRAVGKNPTGAECAAAAKEAGFSFAGIVRLKAKRAKCCAGDLDPAEYGWKGNFGPLADDECDADGTLGAKKVVTVYDVTGDYR